jgi:hypothetical protein
MNMMDWDTQVVEAREAMEKAFATADEMADRIEVLEMALIKAVMGLRHYAIVPRGPARFVLAEIEGFVLDKIEELRKK